ncbi:MAG: response regulator, partial [Rhodoferax sp.]|nr:response regulator [Rhodoferax sp.]
VQARAAENRPYDIVLMDMQMPVMDGVTASRLIREVHSAEQLPIVAMTANAMKADRERCLNAGMNGFITKPINPDALWKVLLTWVKERDDWGQPPLPKQPPADAPLPPSDALMQALQQVDGLDMGLGLSRTNHNPAFYVSLLRKFIAAHQDCATRIRQALQQADLEDAERRAHTLKGVAGNLGASTLQNSADRLESVLKTQAAQAVLEAALADTAQALERLVNGLKAVPGMLTEATASARRTLSAAERAQATELLARLVTLLRQDDPSALELWEANAVVLRAMVPDAEKMETALGGFDFEQALQALEEAAESVAS